MKKLFIFISILLFTQFVIAQKVKTFFEYGINYGRAKEKITPAFINSLNKNLKKGMPMVNIGLKLAFNVDEKFDLLTGINFNNKAYKGGGSHIFPMEDNSNFYGDDNNNFYVDFPFLLSYQLTKNIYLQTGTGLDIHLTNLYNKVFSPIDIPANFGITLRHKRTTLNFLYSIGTISFFNQMEDSWDYNPQSVTKYYSYFNRQLFISLGHCLNKKRKTNWN